ncbi:MAG: hypothetical protein PHS57_06950 [Alphaproteobacteria bacterium]|nr:hypothetical protein [Alphaproteobacteria bacterium]
MKNIATRSIEDLKQDVEQIETSLLAQKNNRPFVTNPSTLSNAKKEGVLEELLSRATKAPSEKALNTAYYVLTHTTCPVTAHLATGFLIEKTLELPDTEKRRGIYFDLLSRSTTTYKQREKLAFLFGGASPACAPKRTLSALTI